jgi:GntR family transcriptional regulator
VDEHEWNVRIGFPAPEARTENQPIMTGPLYRQIADELRQRIDAGEFDEGRPLPTEDELMEQHHASRNTVRNAIKELATRGTVYTQHGKGTFVTEQAKPIVTTLTTDPKTGSGGGEGLVYIAEVAASGRRATTSAPRVEMQKAHGNIANALEVAEGTYVVSRHEQRFVDKVPWSLQTSFYPQSLLEVAPQLLDPDAIPEGTVAYLRQRGIKQAGYRDAIEVRAPNVTETRFFGIPGDGRIEVVEIYRTAFDQRGARVRLTITVYRADKNRFLINVGDVPISGSLRPTDGGDSASQK